MPDAGSRDKPSMRIREIRDALEVAVRRNDWRAVDAAVRHLDLLGSTLAGREAKAAKALKSKSESPALDQSDWDGLLADLRWMQRNEWVRWGPTSRNARLIKTINGLEVMLSQDNVVDDSGMMSDPHVRARLEVLAQEAKKSGKEIFAPFGELEDENDEFIS